MSIKRSLARLENAGSKSNTELLPHLCRLLGTIDACLWAPRFISPKNYHAIMSAQADYHSNGVSFTLEGSTDATWKQSERLRGSLVDAGWATHCDNGKIRLTLAGDTTGRLACGLPTIRNEITVHLFEKLGELPPERHGGWVSESALFALEDDTDYKVIHTMTEIVMPLVVHRCIEAVSSTIARVFYRRIVGTLPTVDAPPTEQVEGCVDAYTASFCRSIEQRKVAEFSGSEIWIPLAATK